MKVKELSFWKVVGLIVAASLASNVIVKPIRKLLPESLK